MTSLSSGGKKKASRKSAVTGKEAKGLWRRVVRTIWQKDQDDLRALVGGDAFPSLPVDMRLIAACALGDEKSVRELIAAGADPDKVCTEGFEGDGYTPLIIAVSTRQAAVVEELLKLGADPGKARSGGKGPLFSAIRAGEEEVVRILIRGGAEVDAPMVMEHNGVLVGGCTPLYDAAFRGNLPVCEVLVRGGASVDAANDLGYTPLMVAIEGGHDHVVEFLLNSGASVNPGVLSSIAVEGLGGMFPLYAATLKENTALVRKLLEHGADINRTTPNGWTSLKCAAQEGYFEIVRLLLEAGADPDIADDTNYTPLMNAVSGQHEDIVRLLLKFKADPDIRSGENPGDEEWESGRCALMDAAFSDNVEIAGALLESGANPNITASTGRTALHSAVLAASEDMVALLLESGADPGVHGNETYSALDLAILQYAIEDDDDRGAMLLDVIDTLLKNGVPGDGDAPNDSALDSAADPHSRVLEMLEQRGIAARPDSFVRDKSICLFNLIWLMGDSRCFAAKLLVLSGADVNYKNDGGLSVLSFAARCGSVRIAEFLLNSGANVMDRNSGNALAYDLAVIYGHDKVTDLLIGHMNRLVPAVDSQAADGTTALMRAVQASDSKAVRKLLQEGADASRRDRNGESPLSYAITNELHEIGEVLRAAAVEKLPDQRLTGPQSIVYAGSQGALGTILDLLDAGTPIDLTDDNGDTALTAAEFHPGVVKALASLGADLSHRNDNGKTAYMIAASFDRIRMTEALLGAGSPVDETEPDEITTLLNAFQESNGEDDD